MKKPLTILVDEDKRKKLESMAKKQDRSLSYIVNKLIDIAIKQLEK